MAEPFSFGIAKGDSQRTKAESGDADEQGLAGSRSGPPVDQRRRTAARGEDARPGLRFRPHRSAKARVARRNRPRGVPPVQIGKAGGDGPAPGVRCQLGNAKCAG